MSKTAKVILRKALSYTIRKTKFKKDVPVVVKGGIVDELMSNNYFSVTLLKETSSKKKSVKKKVKKLRK